MVSLPGALASGNIGDAITDQRPDEVAITQADGTEVSYEEFRNLIAGAQQGLHNAGIKPGDHVALIGVNSIDWLAAFYAIMRAGAVVVPISHKFPAPVLDYVLKNSESKLILVDDPARVPGSNLPVRLLSEIGAADIGLGDIAEADVAPDDPSMVLYTSGSTGKPKGVARSHYSYVWIMEQIMKASDGKDRAIMVSAPLYHMNAMVTVQSALASGDRVVLQPFFEAREFLTTIAEHGATRVTGVPPMMALALREKDLLDTLDFGSVTELQFGSAPLTDELFRDIEQAFPNARLSISYGTTETGPVAFSPHPDGRPTPKNSVGVAHRAVKVRLLDDLGNVLVRDGSESGDVPSGDVLGNLAVSSPAELIDYLNRPDLTRPIDDEGFYVTGDLFRRDNEGFYYFTGRVDDMFASGGENVHPSAVERALEEHASVSEAAVVPVADELKGAKPVAFVVRQPGGEVSEQELKDWVLARMEPYAHPRRVFFLDSLPLSGTNKVDKNSLTEKATALVGGNP